MPKKKSKSKRRSIPHPKVSNTATTSTTNASQVPGNTGGGIMTSLEKENADLKMQLAQLQSELREVKENSRLAPRHSVTNTSTTFAATRKSGYLFKWQDREIGWGGTKWDLRFVRLERGRLCYYKFHGDPSPRYLLTLKNCAVRDDGSKLNKRFRGSKGESPSTQTTGAYFHLFSIYQRHRINNERAQNDRDDSIVPLLRFSTSSLAEKSQWMDLLSEHCAYCDSDDFLDNVSNDEFANALGESGKWNVPVTSEGTLGAMIFASPPTKLKRMPSDAKIPKSASHMKLNTPASQPKSTKRHFYPPSRPFHRVNSPSYLSDEAPMQNYRGLLNLAVIILIISNFRILLGTMKDYGFVLGNGFAISNDTSDENNEFNIISFLQQPSFIGLVLLNIFVTAAYLIERSLAHRIVNENVGLALHYINANLALIIPMKLVWCHISSPLVGVSLLMTSVIAWMKLLSYVHANTDHRHYPERNTNDGLIQNAEVDLKSVTYPSNVTLGNIYYFWCVPTLTYQIAFPRTPRRSWPRVLSLAGRLLAAIALLVFLLAQVVSPTLDRLVEDLSTTEGAIYSPRFLGEYLLKLAIASTYIWLLVFYGYFHLFFNLLAEVFRFGDRVFYRDWWNSSNVSSYWRLWNLPVHYWLVRHLYFPCLRRGINKDIAMIIIFFFSAVMHEVLISIPFHMIRPYSFLGMLGQIPLVILTKYIDRKLPGSSVGNFIFWITFCIVGQPIAVVTYTIDYWKVSQDNHSHTMQCWNLMDLFQSKSNEL